MKLLLDQGMGLHRTYLRAAGVDATHVSERPMARATDLEIIAATSDLNHVPVCEATHSAEEA